MSFKTLNKAQLLEAAYYFDLPGITGNEKNAELVTALEEAEISWNNYQKFVAEKEGSVQYDDGGQLSEGADAVNDSDESEEVVKLDDEVPSVLVKMDRQNPTYQIMGKEFTKAQPFQLVTEKEAQDIIDASQADGGGFRIATPAEARSFFG